MIIWSPEVSTLIEFELPHQSASKRDESLTARSLAYLMRQGWGVTSEDQDQAIPPPLHPVPRADQSWRWATAEITT